jgi:folylpolyglutamate synthase/dihydropteroate synthase
MCNELNTLADEIILTRANNPRASPPDTLAGYFNGKVVHKTDNIQEAKQKARDTARKQDLVLVTGSLFVVGEFRDVKIQY